MKWSCNEHLSLLAGCDMKEEWPTSSQGGSGVLTPAGGDRFLGWEELGVLAGTHEEADKSLRQSNDHYSEDLLSPQVGVVRNTNHTSFLASNTALRSLFIFLFFSDTSPH